MTYLQIWHARVRAEDVEQLLAQWPASMAAPGAAPRPRRVRAVGVAGGSGPRPGVRLRPAGAPSQAAALANSSRW
jgi:hypothetical protein